MAIQWYPGHMHKASKELRQALTQANVAVEILDARIPFSSQNPVLAKLRGDLPCIKVLNKNDLSDPELVQTWQHYFEQEQGVKTLSLNKDQPDKIKQIVQLCRKLASADHKPDKLVHALIMGIPNVGKSTLINCLAGRTVAKTGNEPAVTKQQQRIAIGNNVVLLDTPGLLWPNLENQHGAYRLAATGAIKDTAISHQDIALYVLEYMALAYRNQVQNRFQLADLPPTTLETLAEIGKKRGCLIAGGKVDYDKAAKIILTELRSGSLGQLCLETPAMIPAEMEEVEQLREAKTAKKAARKAKLGGFKN